MSSSLSIHSADINDINEIGFLAQQIWPVAYKDILSRDQLVYMMNLFYSPDSLTRQMTDQKHIFLLLEEDEQPVGFASYSPLASTNIYKLHKLYVLADRQGQGLGKIILDYIVEEIRSKAAVSLLLNVNRNNKARFFYEKLGFSVIAEEDIDIGNNYFMNDYVMEKKINIS
jgi:diamine N-acetyltransferase